MRYLYNIVANPHTSKHEHDPSIQPNLKGPMYSGLAFITKGEVVEDYETSEIQEYKFPNYGVIAPAVGALLAHEVEERLNLDTRYFYVMRTMLVTPEIEEK